MSLRHSNRRSYTGAAGRSVLFPRSAHRSAHPVLPGRLFGAAGPSKPKPADPTAVSILSGKRYEEVRDYFSIRFLSRMQYTAQPGLCVQRADKGDSDPLCVRVCVRLQEFDLETARAVTGKQRSTPWGATVRQAPEILHGYSRKVTGATAEERLDMRAATKADRCGSCH